MRLLATVTRLCAAALAAVLATAPAVAATSFDLRVLNAWRNWVGNADPETAAQGINDLFNNNNLSTGASYTGGLTTPAALYTAIGGSLPVETTPGDLSSQDGRAVGRVRFDLANAAPVVPTVINGLTYSTQGYRLRLQEPTQGSFFNNSQMQFMGEAYFVFVTPLADERYGVRFSDSNGASFDDVITLDVVRMTNGEAGVQIRRLTGTSTSFTTSGVQTLALSSFLDAGRTLADVNAIDLRLFWEPNGGGANVVRGRIELITVQGGVPTGLAGSATMGNTFDIFHGETTTSFQVGASWSPLAPVPEPASAALMLAGLAAVGLRTWRSRR